MPTLRAAPAPRVPLRPADAAVAAAATALAAGAAVAVGPLALLIPPAVLVARFLVREPMALLTLFVWVGLYKEQSIFQAFPVDVTLLLGALLIAVCAVRLLAGRGRTIPLGLAAPVAAIAITLAVSLTWTPAPAYGFEKAWKFTTLTALAALAPFFLVEEERDLRRYFSWTVALAMVTAAFTVANPPASDGRLTIGIEGNTIGISHLLCTGALILLIGALTDLITARRWPIVGAFVLVAVAAAVGSRGPLLSLVLALATTGAVWLVRVPRKVAPVLLVVAAGAALLPFLSLPQDSSRRLAQAVRAPVSTLQADPRYTTFSQALTLIEEHPLRGVGAGGFQSIGRLATPPEDYPHNMVLEVWSELGLVPVVILVASIATLLVGVWRGAWRNAHARSGRLLYVLSGFLLLSLFETMLTGDLIDNRAFWGVFGFAWLVVQHGIPGSAERN